MATDDEIVKSYQGLLILQYRGKTKARAHIDAIVRPFIAGQLALQVQDAFYVETAVGVQLDVLGKYAGVTRIGDSPYGKITLNDSDFRTLIKLASSVNSSDMTLGNIDNILATFFPGVMFVFDFGSMRMGYYISSAIGSLDLIYTFISQGLLPKPMGVQLSSTIVFPELNNFFGYRTYEAPNLNAKPYNTYEDYNEDWPYLSYAYAVNSATSIDQSLMTESTLETIVQEDGDNMYV